MPKINSYYLFFKKLFKDYRTTANAFAKNYNMPGLSATMNKLKNDPDAGVHPETIAKIEKALKIKIDDSKSEITYVRASEAQYLNREIKLYEYPIISQISLGSVMVLLKKENIVDYITLPYDRKENCFAVFVKDDSMSPRIDPGDIVLIDMDLELKNDNIIVALLKNGKQIIRHYKEVSPEIILLHSDNPNYKPITIEKNEIEVIYTIVGTWKNFYGVT